MTCCANIIVAMRELAGLFGPHCSDRTTLDALTLMMDDRTSWPGAHRLFQEIRRKNLIAERTRDGLLNAQYCFEEVCAKSLYNMSREPSPFDPDAPYWIIPNAISLARRLGIDDAVVIRAFAT